MIDCMTHLLDLLIDFSKFLMIIIGMDEKLVLLVYELNNLRIN